MPREFIWQKFPFLYTGKKPVEIFSLAALVIAILAYRKIGQLEKKIETMHLTQSSSPASPVPAAFQPPHASLPASASPVQNIPGFVTATPSLSSTPRSPGKPSFLTSFFRWFAHDWPVKLGALLLFLAVGWIIVYAFWDMIGPMGRVTFGLLLGLAALVFGERRIRSYTNQGGVFLALGAGIIYTALSAARFQYDLLFPGMALLLMFLVTVFIAYVSVVQKSRALAYLGLLLGAIAPLLTNSPNPSFIGLFGYLLVLAAGTIWVVRLRGWRSLTILTLFVYVLYSLSYLWGFSAEEPLTQMLFAVLFGALFFGATLFSALYDEKVAPADLGVALLNALVFLGWIDQAVPPEWKSLVAVAAAVLVSIGAYLVYKERRLEAPVLVHSAGAALLLGAATAYELSGPVLTIAFSLEVGLLVMGILGFTNNVRAAQKASLLFILPIFLSFESLTRYAYSTVVFTGDFFVIGILTVLLFASGWLFGKTEGVRPEAGGKVTAGMLLEVAGFLYFLGLIWLVLGAALPDTLAVTLSLTLYTLMGLYGYIAGKHADEVNKKFIGAALLIFVVAHLLFVEMSSMDTGARILVFSVIGILLMSTAFIGRRKKVQPIVYEENKHL